jgi:hypothetical protein
MLWLSSWVLVASQEGLSSMELVRQLVIHWSQKSNISLRCIKAIWPCVLHWSREQLRGLFLFIKIRPASNWRTASCYQRGIPPHNLRPDHWELSASTCPLDKINPTHSYEDLIQNHELLKRSDGSLRNVSSYVAERQYVSFFMCSAMAGVTEVHRRSKPCNVEVLVELYPQLLLPHISTGHGYKLVTLQLLMFHIMKIEF